MTIVASTVDLQPTLVIGTSEIRVWSSDREARILASIRLGIEQAMRCEGTVLTDDDLKTDDD